MRGSTPRIAPKVKRSSSHKGEASKLERDSPHDYHAPQKITQHIFPKYKSNKNN